MATTNMRIVIRRDDSAAWTANGTVVTLLTGEQGYEVDTGKLKIGNGLDEWNSLPYFAGGITDYDNLTLITDASGVLMLNEESVIGNLGSASTVQEYVDLKDDALAAQILDEAAARELEDSLLGDRIDALTVASEAADTALAAELGDSITALEERSASSDSALQVSIASNQSSINGLDTQLTNVKNESQAADVAINLRIDSVDAKFGSLTAPGQDSSDNVTDFVGLVTGNLGGVNVKTYSDAGDSALGVQISALEAADTVLGGQINAGVAADVIQDARLAALEADSVTATELADAVTALEFADAAQDVIIDALAADSVTMTDLQDTVAGITSELQALTSDDIAEGSINKYATSATLFVQLGINKSSNGVDYDNGTLGAVAIGDVYVKADNSLGCRLA